MPNENQTTPTNENAAVATVVAAPPEQQRVNEIQRQGFADVTMAHENSATQALIAKTTADVQSRWIMAMKRPRQHHNVRQMMLAECERPGFAKVAMYAVPRGGGMIRGLSIRFAEVAMRCMTNMSCEAQTLYDSDEERVIRVTAVDFETNATWSRDITVKKTVERKTLKPGQRPIRDRINSSGDRVYIVEATDDDVRTKEAAEISKASRTAILRLIPGHFQDECKNVIGQTAVNQAAQNPDAEKNAMFDAFAKQSVMPNDIAEWLGHALDKITPAEIVELQMLYRAIRDGEMNWGEATEHKARIRARAREVQQQTAKPAGGQTQKTEASPAAAKPDDKKTEKTATGKGTASTKDKIKEAKADAPKTEPAKPAEKPPGIQNEVEGSAPPKPAAKAEPTPPPVEHVPVKDGYEDRSCATCGVAIEVPIGDPDGAICYACSQS